MTTTYKAPAEDGHRTSTSNEDDKVVVTAQPLPEEPADVIDRLFDSDLHIRDVYLESSLSRTKLVRR
jgi:hypothetical protein